MYSIVYSVTESYTKELGGLQKEVLTHMAGCTAESETVNHIAECLHRAQPTVFQSIKLLLRDNYLEARQPKHRRGPKVLSLTDKGSAAAIITGIDLNQFDSFQKVFSKKSPSQLIEIGLQYVGNITTTSEKRDIMLQKAMEYALKNNLFEQGYIKKMTEEEGRNFIRYIMIEYIKSLRPTNNIKTVEQLLERYQLKKDFLRQYLIQQKESIEAVLRKLES